MYAIYHVNSKKKHNSYVDDINYLKKDDLMAPRITLILETLLCIKGVTHVDKSIDRKTH